MGDLVELRRDFIPANARSVENLDVWILNVTGTGGSRLRAGRHPR
jgi:hypothetical protein